MDDSTDSIRQEVVARRDMTVAQLQKRYEEVFGKPTRVTSRHFLWKRVGYRLQEIAENVPPVSPAQLEREQQLVGMARIRWRDKPSRKGRKEVARTARDPRLPPVGSVLRRIHNRREHSVMVLPDGFEYQGQVYPSLTRVATLIAGTHWSGFAFFNLNGRRVQKGGKR